MKTFEALLGLLEPKKEYDPVLGRCQRLWESFSSEKQDLVYHRILEKKERKFFVDYNPLFAIEKNAVAPEPQVLSYADYYAKYGTTEEQDGWQRVYEADKKRTIYIKQGC